MRTIGVVTVARSDYGIYLPVLRAIQAQPELELKLFVGGMHFRPEFGSTIQVIEQDGFPIAEKADFLLPSDTPESIAESMGRGVSAFAAAYARTRPDILVVLGDRYEMHAAALSALPSRIPVAHIHGGEITEGAIDDALRHSITKLSHLHFASSEEHAARIRQMGEEPWRVTVSGAPGLDTLRLAVPISADDLRSQYGVDIAARPLLVTYHPVTLEFERAEWQARQLCDALHQAGLPALITAPNADTNSHVVASVLHEYVNSHPNAAFVANLGSRAYAAVLKQCRAMVGNSSSGIIEAGFLAVPVVNIGTRQTGRRHGSNVIDVGYDSAAILAAIRRVTDPAFRDALQPYTDYGDGYAADRIVSRLASVEITDALIRKKFCSASGGTSVTHG